MSTQADDIRRLVEISHRRLVNGADQWRDQMLAAIDRDDPMEVVAAMATSQGVLGTMVQNIQLLPIAEHIGNWIDDTRGPAQAPDAAVSGS